MSVQAFGGSQTAFDYKFSQVREPAGRGKYGEAAGPLRNDCCLIWWGVWILADPDEAGLGLAAAIMDILPAARLVKLPADVNETYMQHGEIRRFLNG